MHHRIGRRRADRRIQRLAVAESGAGEIGRGQHTDALALAHELRAAGLTVEVGDGGFKIGKSFGFADAVARYADGVPPGG